MPDNSIQRIIEDALESVRSNSDGKVADYIPELAAVPADLTNIALLCNDGSMYAAGDDLDYKFTLQSSAKILILIGLLEEFGSNKVFSWVRMEPSGDDFSSLARLDQFGPLPSNPMLNSGAICLCSHVPGDSVERLAWLESWMEKLFGAKLSINSKVFKSESLTGARNRSLAYLLKSTGQFEMDVDDVLETYFYTCSFEATIQQAAYLPMLLSNGGRNVAGEQIISVATVQQVLSIMATCGLYNESGSHLLRTGMPAKSSVSGLILASALKFGGFAVGSPRINRKGTSIRGALILQQLSKILGLHFAA